MTSFEGILNDSKLESAVDDLNTYQPLINDHKQRSHKQKRHQIFVSDT